MQNADCRNADCACLRVSNLRSAIRILHCCEPRQRRDDRPRAGGRQRQLITLSDVNAAHDLGLVTPRDSGDRVRDVLSQLIDRELQLAEVDRYAPPEPSAAEVEREVQTCGRDSRRPRPSTPSSRGRASTAHLRETLREDLRFARTSTSAFRPATSAGSRWSTTGWRDCAGAPTSSICIWPAGDGAAQVGRQAWLERTAEPT